MKHVKIIDKKKIDVFKFKKRKKWKVSFIKLFSIKIITIIIFIILLFLISFLKKDLIIKPSQNKDKQNLNQNITNLFINNNENIKPPQNEDMPNLDPNISKLFINNNEIIKYKGQNKKISEILYEFFKYIPYKHEEAIKIEIEKANKYLLIEEFKDDPKFIEEIKIKLLNAISEKAKKNLKHLDTVFVTQNGNFGNSLIALNNIIFYCEILGCKKIILNKNSRVHWHIKNTIFSNKTNLTIMFGESVNCYADNTICNNLGNYFFNPMTVRVESRIDIVKNEILNNLPKFNLDPNDLYIYIRSGDIFKNYFVNSYAQPPLCFYEKVIKNFQFKNIYIIAQDKYNIIIDELIKRHPNIIYNQNLLEKDIAYLVYAYNIVASSSSFLITIIKLNDNIKNLWEYDITRISEKVCHLHHHIFKFPIKYNIYTMMPSKKYKEEMFFWRKTESQLKLMIEEICPYEFIKTKPNL